MKHCILVKWSQDAKNKNELTKEVKNLFDKLLRIDGIHGVDYIERNS